MKMIIYIIIYNCTFLFFWTVSFKKYTVPTFLKIFLNYIYFIILKLFFYMKDIILYKKILNIFLKNVTSFLKHLQINGYYELMVWLSSQIVITSSWIHYNTDIWHSTTYRYDFVQIRPFPFPNKTPRISSKLNLNFGSTIYQKLFLLLTSLNLLLMS